MSGVNRGSSEPRGAPHWPRLVMALAGWSLLGGCAGFEIHDTRSLLDPALHRSEIVGLVAGFGTTFAGLPDLLAMLKRRSTAGMNPRMAAIMCVFQIAWVYYGLLIASRPVIVWNVVAIVVNGLSVGAYVRFAKKEKGRGKDAIT